MNRNRREGITDSWTKADGARSARWGRGKRWLVRWVEEGTEYSKSFAKKSDATAYLTELTTARSTGRFVHERAGRITVGALWEDLESQSGALSAKTVASRETAYRCHVAPRWAEVQVGEVKVTAVRAWVSQMIAEGVGVPTIERAVGALRAVCELAVEDRRLSANPCANVKLPRRAHADRRYLSVEQVDQLATAVDFRPEVVRLLAYTGLRWGEMAALRVADVDFLRRRINVSRSVTEVRGALVWGAPKTHERRSVPFPAALAEELAALAAGKGREDLLVTAAEGGVLRNTVWRPRTWNKALKAVQAVDADFPDISPHGLRHTAASLAISAGANVLALQRMLGHAKASMTLDTYSDLFDGDLDSVAGALDAKIAAARGTAAGPLRDGSTD